MKEKEIKLSCEGTHFIDIADIDDLRIKKEYLDEDIHSLKLSLVESFHTPLFVWKNRGRLFLIDGHKRKKALESLREDGYNINFIPAVEIFAKTREEADNLYETISKELTTYDKQSIIEYLRKYKPKNPGGQPTKLTDETKDKILNHIREGANYKRACILSGISEGVFYKWRAAGKIDRDNGESSIFSRFVEEIVQAQEEYIDTLQKSVNTHAKKDGKLALDVLQRLRPKEFGKNINVNTKKEVNITEQQQLKIDTTFRLEVSDEEDAEVLRVLLEAGAFDERVKELLTSEDDRVHPEQADS